MRFSSTAAVLVLVSVNTCGEFVELTLTVPKLTAAGLKVTPLAVTRSLRASTLMPLAEFLNAVYGGLPFSPYNMRAVLAA